MILREAPNVRYVSIDYGDDIKRIALRELGDASKWVSLVILNELKPPYIADKASKGVLTYGDSIKIPSSASNISAVSDSLALYGSDIYLKNKKLSISNGDIGVVAGVNNFTQALSLHVNVEKNELYFHPEFGCYVRSILGNINGPSAGRLAAFYVKSALIEDHRVSSVDSCEATISGDQISVDAVVVPISGKPIDMQLVI